jgi:hypothetical protein
MLFLSMLSLLLAFVLICSAHPLEKRQSTDSFKLYAYGKDISGLPIFYSNGNTFSKPPKQNNILIART